ncbi:MAG: MgtC/SapB family protein [Oscillospiraceae bacterium]|nr:MgtC/SapB family protein [Oscillospiraceae bacterium]
MLSTYLNSQFSLLQNLDFILRILMSGACGFGLGIERSRRFKEAGVRTHMIVCCAACLIMIVSKYGFADLTAADGTLYNGTRGADPARVAAQVVSGVSFLGAGMIFKNGGSVTGLTTAAGIWATAAIGLAIGSGMYMIGIVGTVIIAFIQMLMHIVTVGADSYRSCNIDITAENTDGFQQSFNELMKQYNATVIECRITREEGFIRYNATLKSKTLITADDVNKKLSQFTNVKEVAVVNI